MIPGRVWIAYSSHSDNRFKLPHEKGYQIMGQQREHVQPQQQAPVIPPPQLRRRQGSSQEESGAAERFVEVFVSAPTLDSEQFIHDFQTEGGE